MKTNSLSSCLMKGAGSILAVALLANAPGAVGPGSVAARDRATSSLVQGFSNPAPITINNGRQSSPSSITVSGFQTEVADVNVTIHNLDHGRSNDVDMLLIGPGGQTATILSDVGSSATGVTISFDDQANNQTPSAGALPSGSFQPTNFQSGDGFGPPAPQPTPTGTELGVFNSTDPNGEWTLLIQDDNLGVAGALGGGWSLRITTANGVPNAEPDTFSTKAGARLNNSVGVLTNDSDPDDDSLVAVLAGKPKQGAVQLQPDGSFTYRAIKEAKGRDSFSYLARDPGGLTDLETVTIQIKKAPNRRK